MFRVRRYRAFLFATVIILGAVYYLGSGLASGNSLLGPSPPPSLKDFEFGDDAESNPTTPLKPVIDDAFWQREKSKAAQEEEAKQAKAKFPQIELPGAGNKIHSTTSSSLTHEPTTTDDYRPTTETGSTAQAVTSSPGFDSTITTKQYHGIFDFSSTSTSTASTATLTKWIKPREHFPVPTEAFISLPTDKPIQIPRIQYDFSPETVAQKTVRQERLDAISSSFMRTWNGYKDFAWGHDELKPQSGSSSDPFCGWAATLVDALDTLWIMDLKEEFKEAVEAASKIDFTVTRRYDIPLFETTIRYLGGLLGAYDISGGQYPVLLEKAVELAEVLIGAFDTPNRMPVLYYSWMPFATSQPRRAGRKACLAEIGSLTVEFTRLAQLTSDSRYYDAVARITDALQLWQNNTALPGMWPLELDSSGCEMQGKKYNDFQRKPALSRPELPVNVAVQDAVNDMHPLNGLALPPALNKDSSTYGTDEIDAVKEEQNVADLYAAKDQSSWAEDGTSEALHKRTPPADLSPEMCKPIGLASFWTTFEKFSIGGQGDSVYEYLPKEWLLLGGVNDQYQNMYNSFMQAFEKHLLYRPMVQDDNDILFSGTFRTGGVVMPDGEISGRLDPATGHLSCFIGGLIGMGAKIFDRKGDLDMAIKLTEACVWAYNSTTTGIMPEHFKPIVCESMDECAWNQTQWYHELDPNPEERIQQQLESDKQEDKRLKMLEMQAEEHRTNLGNLDDGSENNLKEYTDSLANVITDATSDAADTIATGAKSLANAAGNKARGGLATATDKVKAETHELSEAAGNEAEAGLSNMADAVKKKAYDTSDSIPNHLDSEKTAELAKFLQKRQVEELKSLETHSPALLPAVPSAHDRFITSENGEHAQMGTQLTNEEVDTPSHPPPPSHEEYAEGKVAFEKLWPGVVAIPGRAYILRPEAIESVFYMYRITGDESWREKGWVMWQAVETATKAKYGNSAISDVMAETPFLTDAAESFWLAETLKYFYLLFSDPDLVSLDDYVLNTEAHPLLRPDGKGAKS